VMYDQVKSLKQHPPVTIGPSATIGQAIEVLAAANVGAVLVVDDAGRLLGIFSERDLLKCVVGLPEDYRDLPIAQFMTARPECVHPSDTLNFVLQKMDAGGYRHVPVLEKGKPISIISARDMLRFVTRLCKDG
jgi:CBS domain-containing protein